MTKRQKAIEVTEETKKKVLERQDYKSISGAGLNVRTVNYHHVIPRSSSGVGYEWNIVALTGEEHREYHDHAPITINGRQYYSWEEFDTLIQNHLKIKYPNWSKKLCRYNKYKETEEEYGIIHESER
ncbi:MAG: HNH endonuclease [Lachnospiraceae bacterium]|nr:HNH endonuclease [Lachnospiraceae bacterium]